MLPQDLTTESSTTEGLGDGTDGLHLSSLTGCRAGSKHGKEERIGGGWRVAKHTRTQRRDLRCRLRKLNKNGEGGEGMPTSQVRESG